MSKGRGGTLRGVGVYRVRDKNIRRTKRKGGEQGPRGDKWFSFRNGELICTRNEWGNNEDGRYWSTRKTYF